MNAQTNVSDREAALTALDSAYARFLDAFRGVPDEALSFVPPGDEYTLGILPEHLCDSLYGYSSQLDAMARSAFAPLDLSSDRARAAASERRHSQLAERRPTGEEREEMLARLNRAHQRARSTLGAVDEEAFTRTAPVIYSAGGASLPTSARDIAGWLQAHYDEHTDQTGKLLVQWQAVARP